MFHIEATPQFERKIRSFVRAHPELHEHTRRLIDRLSKNPFDHRCKTHGLSGKLKGLHAARIDYTYRLVFILDQETITLINIGSHDDVY